MRDKTTMTSGTETVTITFGNDNSVTVEHSDVNKGADRREFDEFDSARSFYLKMIGSLYLDGWR